jgi:hypothetical protein
MVYLKPTEVSLFLALISSALADHKLPNDLVGCNEVSCPKHNAHGVIEQKCIDKLTERASRVANNADSDACAALERELKNSFDECRDLGGNGRGLGNFTVATLGNLLAVSNSSSPCWPVLPKSDRLAEITVQTAFLRAFNFRHILSNDVCSFMLTMCSVS